MILWHLLMGVVGGYGAHQVRPSLDAIFTSDGMQRIAAYAMGNVLLLAFLLPQYRNLHEVRSAPVRLLVAYLLASCSVGSGVTLGYMVDALRDRDGGQ